MDLSKVEKIIKDSVENLVDTALDETLRPNVTENTTVSLWVSPEARTKLKTRVLNMMISLAEYRHSLTDAVNHLVDSEDSFMQSMAEQLKAACRTLELREMEYSDLLDTILDFDDEQDPDR